MSRPAAHERHFEPERDLAGLPEPVQRYFRHALEDGSAIPDAVLLTMHGRVNAGLPMTFSARQRCDGHAFRWDARAGRGPLRPVRVIDAYDGRGGASTSGWLLGRLRFLHAEDADTGRAAAGRAAAESVWRPWLLLPSAGVRWHAEDEQRIVATFDVAPETVELTLRVRADGALASVSLPRWGNVGQDSFGYIPFGGDVLAEARFGSWLLPSRLRVGWWYGTDRYRSFFDATVTAARAA